MLRCTVRLACSPFEVTSVVAQIRVGFIAFRPPGDPIGVGLRRRDSRRYISRSADDRTEGRCDLPQGRCQAGEQAALIGPLLVSGRLHRDRSHPTEAGCPRDSDGTLSSTKSARRWFSRRKSPKDTAEEPFCFESKYKPPAPKGRSICLPGALCSDN